MSKRNLNQYLGSNHAREEYREDKENAKKGIEGYDSFQNNHIINVTNSNKKSKLFNHITSLGKRLLGITLPHHHTYTTPKKDKSKPQVDIQSDMVQKHNHHIGKLYRENQIAKHHQEERDEQESLWHHETTKGEIRYAHFIDKQEDWWARHDAYMKRLVYERRDYIDPYVSDDDMTTEKSVNNIKAGIRQWKIDKAKKAQN